MKRLQARRGNGRFTRNTLENMFDITVDVCPGKDGGWCGRLLPRNRLAPKRERCDDCVPPAESRGQK